MVSLFLKDSGAHRAQKQLNQERFDSKDTGYLKAMSNYKNIILKSSQRGLKLWHFSGSSEPQLFSKKSSCLLQVIDVRTCLPELALFRYFATKN